MPRTPESKLVPRAQLEALAERLKREGKRIVTTNGCFDLLHWGHLQYLQEARALGDVLVCGVNSDASVRRLKGAERPFCGEKERALQLASLEAVDYVTVFEEDTPEAFLERVCPAIHVKGGDYEGKTLPEARVVRENGGKVTSLSLVPGFSTTELVRKIRALPNRD